MTDKVFYLFSYGTLQFEHVQRKLFGRSLTHVPDRLSGFVIDSIVIADPDVVATSGAETHKILRRADALASPIHGFALEVTTADLPAVDDYEGTNYARIVVTLDSGRQAFAYVAPE